MKTLRVATCQFPVEASITKNETAILSLLEQAHQQGADVAHFSECALSGYAGVEFPDISHLDFDALEAATRRIMAAARRLKLWVLLGSTHRLSEGRKPHNSVYVIAASGRIVNRYDKRFCTGSDGAKPTLDLCHYSPGNRTCVFTIKGVRCAALICYDYRFPELYRDLKREKVQVVLQSFHNARKTVVSDDKYNIWKTIVPATMQCRAAENHFWVSANNSTARPSCWSSFTVRPDGAIVGRLNSRPGLLLTEMTMDPALFDAPALWRDAAMSGQLHSGRLVDDPRSTDSTCL